ncbi:hypothetical protein AGMMS4952_21160 [Spirochaetia bacterium]|nr:hypothetical protein AGMMS4952_21160 [Spirochaetia bacterium]
MAAGVAAKKSATILDVGIGSGAASLCILAREKNVKITGIDISPEMLKNCKTNFELNNFEAELINSDILKWKTVRTFDIVMTNPPFFSGTARADAAHHNANIFEWTRACVRRLKPRGMFYCIIDGPKIPDVIAALYDAKMGGVQIAPLQTGNKIERVIICARSGVKTPAIIFPPLDFL